MGDTPTNRSVGRLGSDSGIPRSTGSSRLVSMQAEFQRKLVLEKEKRLGSPPSSQQSKQVISDNNGNTKRASSALHPSMLKPKAGTGTGGERIMPSPSASSSSPYTLRKVMTGNSDSTHRQFNGRLTNQAPSSPNNNTSPSSLIANKRGVPSKYGVGVPKSTPSTTQRGSKDAPFEAAKNGNTPRKLTATLTRGVTFVKPKPTILVLPADSHIGPEVPEQRASRHQDCLARAADTSTGSDTADENDPSPRAACPKSSTKPRSVPTRSSGPTTSTKPQPPASLINKNITMRVNGASTPTLASPKMNSSAKHTPKARTVSRTPTLAATKTSKAFRKIERTEPPPPGTVPCSNCGRCFLEERVAKHESICKKSNTRKRKIFDPTKMRVAGTEAEAYLKLGNKKPPAKNSGLAGTPGAPKKPDWRQKHEDFIRTIRAAKEYQKHIAAGGNPKDLPPPPPSDYSDYVPCPHCKRKFNAGAAERHIPKCLSNKNRKR